MKDDLFPEMTRHRLAALAGSGALPERVREQANRLLERLDSAVRVVVLGPVGVGKSDLICALLGEAVARCGDVPLVIRHESCDAAEVDGPRYARFRNPAMAAVEFVDVPFPADPRRQAATIGWALGQADVVVWCTRAFGPGEAPYWAGVPEQLKDHSFLVLTRARALMQSGEMDRAFATLRRVAEAEFHSLFVVETGQVRAALDRAAPVDDETDAQSGVAALRQAILDLAATGRRAWEDAALLLLDRFGRHGGRAKARAEPEPQPEVAAPTGADSSGEERSSSLARGLRYIDACARDIDTGDGGRAAARLVLDHCLETCEAVAELIAASSGPGADHARFQDDVALAADKMLLIAMEDGPAAAADSVTILLQIRRELELRQAA